ncbi:MAG TPA: calcineurin-like phosphoesterase C-terminal domain-containing protein, partial [Gemmatimonas sp.]|nr:calcineurin-like phosphoesterase C-terminal domain-containing protein [Gemmatimonas sp.]
FNDETMPDLVQTVRTLVDQSVFSVSCGDIVFDQLALFEDYEKAMQRLGIPAFQVIGNHDLDKDGYTWESGGKSFRTRFGPTYYSFDRGRVHYVILDNVFWHGGGYIGYLDASQLAWLEQDLARVTPGSPVVVLLHIPVEGTRSIRAGGPRHTPGGSTTNRDYLYKLLAPFKSHIIAGHTHDGEHVFAHATHAQIAGTVCGAWWTGDIAGDGTPNGYAVYEASGETITWRYKSTGFPDTHQIRAYARGAVPQAPHEIVANVWNWDPEWRVTWYEGGDRRGILAPRVAIDPLARRTLVPDKLPERHQWVTPFATEHLLFAPVDDTVRGPLRIEAVDRFGRTFSTEVPRA